MPTPIPPEEAQRALHALGVEQSDLEAIRRSPLPKAQTLLEELKKRAHRKYKQLALELHPDRTKGDQAKADFFVLLGRVLEELDKTKVQARPQIPHFQVAMGGAPFVVNVASPMTWAQVSTSTTSTVTTGGYTTAQVIRVVRMRPK